MLRAVSPKKKKNNKKKIRVPSCEDALFPGYVAGDALHPRTWQPEQDELRWPLLHTVMDMESGWTSVVTAGGLARGRVRTREDFEEGTYEAVWMLSGTPRLHWRERRAATQAADDAAPPAPRTTPPPALESLEDVLAVPEGHERPPWQQAYAHLRDNTLDRGQRAFAWQLLHAALVPRAARVAHDDRLGPTEGVCTHPNCPTPCGCGTQPHDVQLRFRRELLRPSEK